MRLICFVFLPLNQGKSESKHFCRIRKSKITWNWKAKKLGQIALSHKFYMFIHLFSSSGSFSSFCATFVELLLNSNHNNNCILMCGCWHMCKEMVFRWSWKLQQYHYREALTLIACSALLYGMHVCTLNRYGAQSGFCRIPLIRIKSICCFIFISSSEPFLSHFKTFKRWLVDYCNHFKCVTIW